MALSCCASHAAAVYGLGFRVNGSDFTVAFSVHPCRKGSNPELFLFVARPVPWKHKSNGNGIGFKRKTIPKNLNAKVTVFVALPVLQNQAEKIRLRSSENSFCSVASPVNPNPKE